MPTKERRSNDIWLGQLYILNDAILPILTSVISTILSNTITDWKKRKDLREPAGNVHADITIIRPEGKMEIHYTGEPETLLKIFKTLDKKTKMPKVSFDELEEYCDNLIVSWRKSFGEKQYERCAEISEKFIGDLKPLYKERSYGESDQAGESYSYMYLFMMLAKAFDDIIKLVELTIDKTWPSDQKKTEIIWQVLWDAKERLDIFDSNCTERDLFSDLFGQLKNLEHNFYDVFGKGIYMSAVILIKKSTCTICGMNIKGCVHIPGNLYNGKYCRQISEDIEIHGADFVQYPHDMRCRVWPWNFTEKNRITARILNVNKLDDFIER